MRIIGFNGPPRCGKDTLGKAIQRIHEGEYRFREDSSVYDASHGAPFPWGVPEAMVELRACIMPIRKIAMTLLGLPYSEEVYESIKDTPHPEFNGETLRMFMIRLMQEHIKPKYGEDFAIRTLMSDVKNSVRIHNSALLWCITDIGFQEEVEYLERLVGFESFVLVSVSRNDLTFVGDSRSYVSASQVIDYRNAIEPELGARKIMGLIHKRFGWEF